MRVRIGGRRWHGALRPLGTEVAEWLLPQRCLRCGRFGAALHEHCVAALPRAVGPRCDRCWGPRVLDCTDCGGSGPLGGTRSAFRFEGDARAAIIEAKFRGRTALLRPLAVAAAAVVPPEWAIEVVTAVPQDRARQRRRGFNPAGEAARTVADSLGVPYRPALLRRVGGGPRQATLSRGARMLAVRRAFHAGPPGPLGPSTERAGAVLIVDDVATTGSTLIACAAALLEAGHPAAYAVTLARED